MTSVRGRSKSGIGRPCRGGAVDSHVSSLVGGVGTAGCAGEGFASDPGGQWGEHHAQGAEQRQAGPGPGHQAARAGRGIREGHAGYPGHSLDGAVPTPMARPLHAAVDRDGYILSQITIGVNSGELIGGAFDKERSGDRVPPGGCGLTRTARAARISNVQRMAWPWWPSGADTWTQTPRAPVVRSPVQHFPHPGQLGCRAALSRSTVCVPLPCISLINVVGCGTGEVDGIRVNCRQFNESATSRHNVSYPSWYRCFRDSRSSVSAGTDGRPSRAAHTARQGAMNRSSSKVETSARRRRRTGVAFVLVAARRRLPGRCRP